MKIVSYILFGCLFGVLMQSAGAQPVAMAIVTGAETGTYYRFGQDMRTLAAEHGIELEVLPSTGSVENMLAIYDSRSTQLGIAQSDVTLFMNLLGDDKTKAIAREIKVVFPLYDEEVHLLASKKIQSLADLNGKKVAVGKTGSGTAMTASIIFEVANIRPAEKRESGGQAALDALRQGKIDAMFYVIGQPAALFRQSITAKDDLHLVPITEASIIEVFGTTGTIPASAYAWQDKATPTLTVKAGLMTLDYNSDNVNCGYVGQLARLIQDNLDWFKQNGHEKWQSVDLTAPVHASLRSPCVERGLE